MNDKMKPALIGGVVLGLLSAIPFVNMVNMCCCAWAIAGGVLAANMYIKNSTSPVSTGDGAQVGAIAGVIGAVIYLVLGVPLGIMAGQAMVGSMTGMFERMMPPEQAAEVRRQMEMQQAAQGGFIDQLPQALMFGLIGAILLVVFATVGGLIGTAIFEKRKGGAGAPPPPPPPNFGGPAGGTYGAGS